MMILIHGDNTVAALNRLLELKSSFTGTTLTFYAKDKTPATLREALSSESLFSDSKLLIIENPASAKKLFDDIAIGQNSNLLLFENRKLTSAEVSAFQKKIPGLKAEEFKLEPVVFKFLESLAPDNQKIMLLLLKQYLKPEEPEIAIAMLARQLRLLIAATEEAAELEDFSLLPPWQKQRLISQARKFDLAKLLNIQAKLLTIDYQLKTGRLPVKPEVALELLLASF